VEIVENSSWSCAHGLERWRKDCGCNGGGQAGWNQGWRGPLREALDWLRDTLARGYECLGGQLFKDPWAARNDYIDVILERSTERFEHLLGKHATHRLDARERVKALQLLELQRHALLMYTSCGWFFDELSRPETVQVVRRAARAVQIAEESFGETVESNFLERLEQAKSNIPEHRDGRQIYEKWVRPAVATFATRHRYCGDGRFGSECAKPVSSGGSRTSFWKLLQGLQASTERSVPVDVRIKLAAEVRASVQWVPSEARSAPLALGELGESTAQRVSSGLANLMERLDQQVVSLRSLGETWTRRIATLEHLREPLSRADGSIGSGPSRRFTHRPGASRSQVLMPVLEGREQTASLSLCGGSSSCPRAL